MSNVSVARCQSSECREPVAGRIGPDVYPLANTTPLAVLRTGTLKIRCDRDGCGVVTMVQVGAGNRPRKRPMAASMVRLIPIMPPDQIVSMMEERWESFRVEKLRKRGTIAVGLRFDVFMRDGFCCRYCGVSVDDGAILHADHVIAESKGGPTTLENLVTACMDCNLGKSDKDLPD